MESRTIRRIGVVLLFLLLLVGQGNLVFAQQTAQQISDVPADHWAYEGVQKLVQEGYLALYTDGTFQGQRPVDRYTLASVVGRLLVDIEKGQLGVTQEDLELLRTLSTEFRDELVRWYNQREELSASVTETQRRVQVMDETVTKVIDTMEQEDAAIRTSIQEQAAAILAEIAALQQQFADATRRLDAADADLRQQTADHGRKIQSLEDELVKQAAALADTEAAVEANETKLAEHTRMLALHTDSLIALEEALGVKVQSSFAERDAAMTLLQQAMQEGDAELLAEINRVEKGLSEVAQQLIQVEQGLISWQEESAQIDAQLTSEIGQLRQALVEERQTRIDETSALSEGLHALEDQVLRQGEAMASADGQLMKDVSGLRQDLVRSLEAVQTDLVNISQRIAALDKRTDILQQGAAADSKDLADLRDYVAELQAAVSILQERVSATESTLAAVDERVMTQSSAQINAALMREQRLERQLQELRDEFDSYRNHAEKQNQSLKSAANIATIAAVLALILGFVN